LCTPTMVSKGALQPSDICLVDLDGNQKAGTKKRTSEVLMHLQIMKAQPKAKACVHAHPPHATAFAVAGIEPPTCLLPEYEVFCAVATAPYRTPGTAEMGKLVADLADKHNTILMANHGVVAWTHNDVEEAYWRMEIIEAYCRTVVVAAQLGKPLTGFAPTYMADLLKIKQGLGFVDPRYGLKECELCDNSDWRPGVVCQAPPKTDAAGPAPDSQCEDLVKTITDMILAKLKG
jgi:L-fuculose-phosphate aldolase